MVASASYAYTSGSLEDTVQLAAKLASRVVPGTVITLDGDLGAGKTAFSQAFAKALGVKDIVSSPTFTIIKEYESGCLPFYHMDVYRLSMEEADELGLEEYFYGEGVSLVEWSSLIPDLLPQERLSIHIELSGEDGQGRLFRLQPHGEPYKQWCIQLKENGDLQ